MESISEPMLSRIIFRVVPVFVCLGQWFVIVISVLTLFLVDWPPLVVGSIIFMALVGLALLPLWYKTFFRRDCVGMDRPIVVEWSEDEIVFRGAYFRIAVPVENVVSYKTIGVKSVNSLHMLKVVVRKTEGSRALMWLSTSMPRKNKFLSFLEKARTDLNKGR